ncbi:SpoIIE family protein phosphatase [Streptomyces sp. NPDC008317]|uniref:PP2C family protein-serine/threonine phosphatase n=1 Tax=Streptomyces sp. NPDC008317 TaxID=3364827 RepID=UPI0036E83632
MKTIRSRWRSWWPDVRWDPVLLTPLLLTVMIIVVALVTPTDFAISRLLPAAPALAASMWPVRPTVALGVVATAVVVGDSFIIDSPNMLFTAGAIAVVTAAAGYAAHSRLHREETLTQVRSVADTAQAVVLRPVPPRVGNVDVETLYVAAAAEARIGGDFYAAADTPHGVRLLIGDVRGKGLNAAGAAGAIANSFRDAAHDEPDLAAVARRLDRSVVRYSASIPGGDAPERFATALFVEIPADGGHAVLLNCGHPPPLLLRGDQATSLDPSAPSPPLNMAVLIGSDYRMDTVPLVRGDRLLLYTDGVIETRDDTGAFFSLRRWVSGRPPVEPRELLDQLRAELLRFSDGQLDDDIAAVLVRSRAGACESRGSGSADGSSGSGGGSPGSRGAGEDV